MGITIPVVEADLSPQGIGALIGRDLLSKCLLIYNGETGFIHLAY